MVIYSTTEVAAMLGKAPVTVRKAARDYGIGSQAGRSRVFTPADIERLRKVIHERDGRPVKAK